LCFVNEIPRVVVLRRREAVMTRNIILAVLVAIASLAFTPIVEAKKGGNGNWKGPPPRGNAWGYYKKFGWPDYGYGGYRYSYAPPPAFSYYGYERWPAPTYGYPPPYAPLPPPAAELLPPPPPPY
jgi:hypothetical protein